MAAPAATVRTTPPAGIPLQDGYQALITLALDADIEFSEKTVTPPSIDGGDAVDTTTMHNVAWKTSAPQELVDSGEISLTVAYDPEVYVSILAAINRRDTISVLFGDGSTLALYGFLRVFEPAEMVQGTQPEANIIIESTCWDHVNNVEAAPVLVSVPGT